MEVSEITGRGRLVLAGALVLVAAGVGVSVAHVASGTDDPSSFNASPSPTVPADTTPPKLVVERPSRPVVAGKRVILHATIKGGKILTTGGRIHRVALQGHRWTLTIPKASAAPIVLVATDAAGNETKKTVRLHVHHLARTMHAVHVSAYGWSSKTLRRPLFEMIHRRQINTIEIDLKDESGIIGYNSKIPLAKRIHSDRGIYDLKEVIDRLHHLNVRVIGRLVAFRDPVLANAAWKHGHHDWVIQTPKGGAYADYGGFTNFAHPAVRKYNVDIAEEAARAGIDDVLYDYVRRPDGPIGTMVFKGLKGSPEKAIAGFVAETEKRLRRYGTRLGASVFGIAATRPKEIAQDIPHMAKAADYISPMLYPSHWARGEYNVGYPNAHPYEIVQRSLKDFLKAVKGTGAEVIPWIQDFSLGIHYGPREVGAQLDAARHRGIHSWILWDPTVTYTRAALPH